MIFVLLKLQLLKTMRSTAFAKSVLVAVFLAFLAVLLLGYVLIAGLFLREIIVKGLEKEDAYAFLSANLIFFYLTEFMYRYFLQKLPVLDLQNFLHLPIKKKWLMHFLLGKSVISPLTMIAPLLFSPFAFMEIAPSYGMNAAIYWLGAVVLSSWSLHWLMLWFKQKFEDSLYGIGTVFVVLLLSVGSNYFGWFNLGEWMKPLFDWSLSSPLPVLILLGVCIGLYQLAYRFYFNNAYLEDLVDEEVDARINQDIPLLERFGLAGELANLEWKLILRHKKSRTYLMMTGFLLLYGLFFYTNPIYQADEGFSHMFIFVGTFITGIFMLQYGQLFLSWNSSNFDFYINQKGGLEALIRGKYLLFIGISFLCLLLSIPYVYFGVEILLIHLSTFLFNVGVVIHAIIYLALWKPKPMDLNKGAMFNYEGVGIAQFLMIIPVMVLPYAVYLPLALLANQYAGLVTLAALGVIGIILYPYLVKVIIARIQTKRYEISAAFRQEL